MARVARKVSVLIFALVLAAAAVMPVAADETDVIATPTPTPKGGGYTMNCCGW